MNLDYGAEVYLESCLISICQMRTKSKVHLVLSAFPQTYLLKVHIAKFLITFNFN